MAEIINNRARYQKATAKARVRHPKRFEKKQMLAIGYIARDLRDEYGRPLIIIETGERKRFTQSS